MEACEPFLGTGIRTEKKNTIAMVSKAAPTTLKA